MAIVKEKLKDPKQTKSAEWQNRFGEQFHIQFDSNKPWLMARPQGQQRPFWQQVGSAWMDFLRNIRLLESG